MQESELVRKRHKLRTKDFGADRTVSGHRGLCTFRCIAGAVALRAADSAKVLVVAHNVNFVERELRILNI